MKRTSGFFKIIMISIIGLLFSCEQLGLYVPEKVSVETGAEYNIPLGTASYNTSDVFDLSSLKDTIQESLGTTASIYSYEPVDDETLSYLIHYPFYKVPIDVGSYFEDFDLDSVFNSSDMGFSFDQEIAIPDIPEDSRNISKKKDLDIDTSIRNSMNETLSIGDTSYTLPELGSGNSVQASEFLKDEDGKAHNSIEISGTVADEIVYRDGSSIYINFNKTDTQSVTEGFEVLLTAVIYNSSSNEEIARSNETDVSNGGTIEIDLSGVTFPKDVKIVLDGTISGGTLYVLHNYDVVMTLSDETSIRSVSGINANPEDVGLPAINYNEADGTAITIDMSDMKGYFEYLIVKEGGVSILGSLPSEWTCTGISLNSNLKFNGIGLSDLSPTNVENSSYLMDQYLDLADETITVDDSSSSLVVTGTIEIVFDNASIDFGETEAENPQMEVKVSTSIDSIKEAKIDFTSDKYSSMNTSYSLPTDGSSGSVRVPAELLKYVNLIDFCSSTGHYKSNSDGSPSVTVGKGFGLTCTTKNSFPKAEGKNNIPISLESSFFKFSKEISITGTGTTDPTDETWNDYPQVDLSQYDDDGTYYIDFSFNMGDSLVLYDLTMGSTYEISVENISLLFDWDYIDFNASSTDISGETDLSSFDLSSIFSALPFSDEDNKKVQIATLPIYFYAQGEDGVGDLLGGITPTGLINMSYTDSDGVSKTEKLLGNNEGAETLNLVDPISWPETNEAITWAQTTSTDTSTDTTNTLGGYKATFYKDLAGIINDSPSDLALDYSISLGGNNSEITIYSTELDSLKSSGPVNISIDMVAILMFKLNLTGKVSMNIMDYVDKTWTTDTTKDLLGRESASSTEEYASYADALEKFKLNYNITNDLFSGIDLSLSIIDVGSELNKTLTFNSGNNTFELTSDDVKNVMTRYPFHPLINLALGSEDASVDQPDVILIKRFNDEETSLSAAVSVGLKMNGETPIKVWGSAE